MIESLIDVGSLQYESYMDLAKFDKKTRNYCTRVNRPPTFYLLNQLANKKVSHQVAFFYNVCCLTYWSVLLGKY